MTGRSIDHRFRGEGRPARPRHRLLARRLRAGDARVLLVVPPNGRARRAADDGGGVLVTMSCYGADKVVNRYNMMGPVKSALEGSVHYMAAELGPNGVRATPYRRGP
jgi:NAD(P)-dependent dehydrogenase (short-subunit alcohol dehydrogenase family)